MAKRDKLTQKQRRQIAQQRRQRLNTEKSPPQLSDLSPTIKGLLVSRYGEQADVLDIASGQKYRCYLRQNLGGPVTGDIVRFRLDPNSQGIVEAIEERSSLLQRPAQNQGLKPVVANISRIFVVVAPLPDFSSTLLDRYLVAVREAKIDTIIIANKWDLDEEIKAQKIQQQLQIYQDLGYPIIHLSTKTGKGIDALADSARNQKSILVGQSGVGKSSIINHLFPGQSSLVNEVSGNSRLGQHTTTASQLFQFEQSDGFIIDSPGIREFGLWHMDNQTIARGFVEFEPYIGSCRFRDCQHIKEPGCEIMKALENGRIALQRWQNYIKIIQSKD